MRGPSPVSARAGSLGAHAAARPQYHRVQCSAVPCRGPAWLGCENRCVRMQQLAVKPVVVVPCV